MNTIIPNPQQLFGKRPSHVQPIPSERASAEEASEPLVYERPEVRERELGNVELPIAQHRQEIVDAVGTSQVVVLTAETGAGKSTQVPQFLAEEGYGVIVTQPRVVAARNLAGRVGDEVVAKMGSDYSSFVGYRTAKERHDSAENQVTFITDGLQQVRELAGSGVGKKQVLVLDEVHEWNENMEVLVAWAKKRVDDDPDFKVVVMSATMESDKLAEYFARDTTNEVPVIEVPGRTFEVKREEGGDVAEQTIRLAREGKSTLVFVPGKAEIDDVMTAVSRANIPGVTVLPLHGQLDKDQQQAVFKTYAGTKVIVATNVAQTSVTIEGIDAVVDSGLERQNQVRDGVEGLYLNPISQADCLQRAGRAGRTKNGEYVLAKLGNYPFVSFADRAAYGTPEIMRTRLDGLVLRLSKHGLDADTMEFYHQPDKAAIASAKRRLEKLGAVDENGVITHVGRQMERMPVESHYARMMIEARKYGKEVQGQLAAMLAIQEVGGITFSGKNSGGGYNRFLTRHNDSDMIKQLEVYIGASDMNDTMRREHDVITKNYRKVGDILKRLKQVEKLNGTPLEAPTAEQREALVKCIVSGMVDNLYISEYGNNYSGADGRRETGRRSLVSPGKMIVGVPFDLQTTTRRGPLTLHLLENVTNVPSLDVLREVAPQLFSERSQGYRIGDDGTVQEDYRQFFNGRDTNIIEAREAEPCEERRQYLVGCVASGAIWGSEIVTLRRAVEDLQNRSTEPLATLTQRDIFAMLDIALPPEVANLHEAELYVSPVELDDLVDPARQAEIRSASPDTYEGLEIRYSQGRPYIEKPSDEVLVVIPETAWYLPDGRAVTVRNHNGSYNDIASSVAAAHERLERVAQQKAEERAERIFTAAQQLANGFTEEGLVDWEKQVLLGVNDDAELSEARDIANQLRGPVKENPTERNVAEEYPTTLKSEAPEIGTSLTRITECNSTQDEEVTADMLDALRSRFNG